MIGSEGARRMIALGTIALGVVVQTVATRDVGADTSAYSNDFGVRLLKAELSAPVSPAAPPALTPAVAEQPSPAATFLAPLTEPEPLLDPVAKRGRNWMGVLSSELGSLEVRPDRSQDREVLNRDSFSQPGA